MARFIKVRRVQHTSTAPASPDTDVRIDLDKIVGYQPDPGAVVVTFILAGGDSYHVPYSEKLIAYLDRELRVKDIENVDTRTDAEYFAQEG